MFQPLADRVLIKPETPPTQTASGLHLSEHWKPEQTGTVVAVGKGRHPFKDEAFALAQKLERVEYQCDTGDSTVTDAAQMLRDLTGREPEVKVGDYVIFSWQSGQELWVNHGEERLLLMHESDILAVVETAIE